MTEKEKRLILKDCTIHMRDGATLECQKVALIDPYLIGLADRETEDIFLAKWANVVYLRMEEADFASVIEEVDKNVNEKIEKEIMARFEKLLKFEPKKPEETGGIGFG